MKEDVENIPVWVKLHGIPITAFNEDGSQACSSNDGAFGCVELKDTIVVAMPKLTREGFYTCTDRVEYEWKPSRCLGVVKNLNKPSPAATSVPVGLKGTSNLVCKESNSSGSSFWNVKSSSASTTPIVDKIRKFEKLIIDGKVTFVNDEGEPVKKVDYPVDHDSEDEVESVDNDITHSMASEKVGFGTNSLLEQLRDSYENDDYDYDPYDDDMYEGQEILDKIQTICDNLDIKV
ncbi:hypothetical protein Tco_0529775 [Tanacetum coccineum]